MYLKRVFCALGVILALQPLRAAESDILPIAKIAETVEFTGLTDKVSWESATPMEMRMYAPNFGKSPNEQTEVRLGYDEQYLWVFARLHYADASKIVSTSKKRDEESKNSDSFGIILDTYDDNQSGLAFFTTPSGQRIDYAISNDANSQPSPIGNMSLNYSWNTFWDVKTARIEDGWSVEMRIPFSSLRFQEKDGKVKMGLILNRSISYCNELDTYPEIDPKYGMFAPTKPSLAQTIEMNGIKPAKPVYITPYVLTGFEQNQVLNEAGTKYSRDDKPQLTGGLDVKYSLTSNLTLDLTANTDFAQVEADDQILNTTRYSLFFPEKRMFFQERSSIFGFNLGDSNELFYSRRIGMSDGNPVRIFGGARLTGRVGNWDVGMLDMQTEKYDATPSENFGVLRMRHQVFNPNSYVGFMGTSRIGTDGSRNLAYGADGIFRIFGNDYIETRFAQTTNGQEQVRVSTKENSFAFLKWERRNDKGLSYNLRYYYSGLEFNPGSGFLAKPGTKGPDLMVRYGWLPGENSKIMSFKISTVYEKSTRLIDDGLENLRFGSNMELRTKTGWGIMGSINYMKEGVLNEFLLSDVVSVPVGEYSTRGFMSSINTPFSKPVVLRLTLNSGEYYDGNMTGVTAMPTLNLSSSIQVTGTYSYNKINFDSRNQHLTSHIGRLKLTYMYSTKMSLSSFVQYNSSINLLIANFRLRYNPKEGNDFYLVYNENRPSSNYSYGEANHVQFFNRSILLKYVYTFKI